MPTLRAARACWRLRSTPQSVEPATSWASGRSAMMSSVSASDVGRTNSPWVLVTAVCDGAGAGWEQRVIERVVLPRLAQGVRGVADRPVAGAAAQVAAQRVQVEAVRTVFMIMVGAVRASGVDRWSAAGPRR